MVFGFFKKNEQCRIKELAKRVNNLEDFMERLEGAVVKPIGAAVTRIAEIEKKMEAISKSVDEATEQHLRKRRLLELLEKPIMKDKQNEKTPNPDVPKNKINTATAILNILKDSKNPLDFNSIKDKIKEYDLKSIDVSDKSIKQSIYNLVYAKKISRSKKNGKGMCQIRASTTKQ